MERLDDAPDVDPLIERLTHAPVGKGVPPLDVRGPELGARLVEAEVERLIGLGLLDFQARRGGDPLELVRRRRLEHVDLAREEKLSTLSGVRNPSLHDAIDVVRVLRETPPVGVANQHRSLARLELLEQEGAGAVGVRLDVVPPVIAQLRWQRRAVALRPGLRHDGNPQVLPGDRVGSRGCESNGVGIDRLDPGDTAQTVPVRRCLGFRTLDTEDHVGAGEGSAVMERDTLAQLHLPGQCIEPLPAHGEPWLEPPLQVVVDEALKGQILDPDREQLVMAVRIEGFGRLRRRPAHHVLRPGGRDKAGREQRKGDENRSNAIHGHLPSITGTASGCGTLADYCSSIRSASLN